MTRFDKNVLPMLKREGYYSNRKADLGGETYRGSFSGVLARLGRLGDCGCPQIGVRPFTTTE